MTRTWYVYVLRLGDGTLYTGVTTHLSRRIGQHGDGTGAKYTRGRGKPTLHYWEAAATKGAALSREAAIKRLSRAEKLALVGDSTIRPATPKDQRFIETTIRKFDLDPTRLFPEQFFIAMEGRQRAGFARIKPHARCFELGALAVLEKFRHRGIGEKLVRHLQARFPTSNVWVTTMIPKFFRRLGFEEAKPPADLRRKLKLLEHLHYEGAVALKAPRVFPTPAAGPRPRSARRS